METLLLFAFGICAFVVMLSTQADRLIAQSLAALVSSMIQQSSGR